MTSENYKKLVSDTISNIRFPLMIGVIISHCNISNCTSNESVNHFAYFTSEQILLSGIVPMFFLMSGFLFFWKNQTFSVNIYCDKLRSRIRNILKPYLIWNTFMILCYAAMHILTPSLISSDNENVLQYTWIDWISAYWNKVDGYPVCYALWFLRNLFIIVVFSPILFFFLERKYLRWMFLFGVLLISFLWPGHGLVGLIYFYLGALLSRHEIENSFVELTQSHKGYIVSICLVCLMTFVWLYASLNLLMHNTSIYFMAANRISAVCILLVISVYLTRKYGYINSRVADSGYFMYLFHAFPVFCIGELLMRLCNPSTLFDYIFVYIAQIIFTVFLCIGTYKCLIKYYPRTTLWLTGK